MDAVPTMIHKLKGRARKHEDVVTKHGDLVSVLRLDKYAVLTSTISTTTTQTLSLCHHHRLPHLSDLHLWQQAHLRNPSRLDIAGKRKPPSMNLKNISNSLLKILTHAIRFTGGLADELSSQIYFAWLAISCVFLVSRHLSVSYRSHFQTYLQVPLSLLRESSQVVATQSPSGVLASMPTPFASLCLLRSGCTLPVLRPTLPCVVKQPKCKSTIILPCISSHLHRFKAIVRSLNLQCKTIANNVLALTATCPPGPHTTFQVWTFGTR
jgi:hypothetical protein